MKKSVQIIIKKELDEKETKLINKFIENSNNFPIEQRPTWYKKSNCRYFYIISQDRIVAFSKVKEMKVSLLKFASLAYAPSAIDNDNGYELIKGIVDYYSKKNFVYLSIQLGTPISNSTEFIDRSINKNFRVKYFWGNGYAKSTIRIRLDSNISIIKRSFRKGHKSGINKAQKSLTVKQIKNEEELNGYYYIFNKMSIAKGIYKNSSFEDLKKLFYYLKKESAGFILGVYNGQNKCVGGVVIVSNGRGMRYYQGASDPDIRNVPILHLAIYKSIEVCIEQSKLYLDLWGYNFYAQKENPVYGINRFKKGFSNEIVFYPKQMHFILKPFGKILFDLSVKIYSRFMKK